MFLYYSYYNLTIISGSKKKKIFLEGRMTLCSQPNIFYIYKKRLVILNKGRKHIQSK